MTNVPNDIREMWKEIYILFDKHYLMDVSKIGSWESFWDDAKQIIVKYEYVESLIDLLEAVSEIISKEAARRKTNGKDQ